MILPFGSTPAYTRDLYHSLMGRLRSTSVVECRTATRVGRCLLHGWFCCCLSGVVVGVTEESGFVDEYPFRGAPLKRHRTSETSQPEHSDPCSIACSCG